MSRLGIKRLAFGAAFGLVATFALAFASALFISGEFLPPGAVKVCALGSVFLGGLLTAFLSSGRRRRLLNALLGTALLFALLFLSGAAFLSGAFLYQNMIWVLIVLVFSCILGTALSIAIR